MHEHLFVYGTLAPGKENAHILAGIKGTWTPATIRGILFPNGIGAAYGFPAVIPDETGDLIKGFIFRSKYLMNHWQQLDEFEGNGYERVKTTAQYEDGSEVQAFVYALNSTERHLAYPSL